MTYFLEYIWLGGTGEFRSKVRIMDILPDFPPTWNYDGSSTGQATTESSQCTLIPVRTYTDRKNPAYIYVLCDTPERQQMTATGDSLDMWIGFEQEFFIWDLITNKALGVYENMPGQGPYYCGVEAVSGYEYCRKHTVADLLRLTELIARRCCDIGCELTGYNLEVAPGQTEIQVMSRSALKACDDLMMMRFMAHRVLIEEHCKPVWDPKPLGPEWNGTGLHTNISTAATRRKGGLQAIHDYMDLLSQKHAEHLAVYGAGNESRLTGKHETSSMDRFTWSVGGRHTSVRIPTEVTEGGSGYFEDRRPAGNANPYLIAERMLRTLTRS